ncbi:MAG: hypothetical protein Q8P86_00510, partial [bacterium]|nr:hypothetical protein [bacterium]
RWISFQFRARRSKNYEAYTEYLLNNFCEAVAEIEKKDADLEFRNSKSNRANPVFRYVGLWNSSLKGYPSNLYPRANYLIILVLYYGFCKTATACHSSSV